LIHSGFCTLLLFLLSRDDKGFMGSDRGWYVPIRGHSFKGSCEPLGAMVLSLPTPGYGKPCLITVDEVQELMRQFGNLLLHMSATSPWSDLCGKQGIEWDAIDVSQHFMIEWLYTPDFLASVSGHWSTNEPISPGVVDSICSSRHHMAGFELCTELFKAAYDISFFTE
jgi:oligopeptidase A